MKKGLVLEGGAMRGMFTAGVLDVLMENDIKFDGAVGVSAGAIFGCNIKSHQIGRSIRYNMRFSNDPRYCSFRSLIKTGDIYNADFCYREVIEDLDPFDTKTFSENPMEFYVVATDIETGKPVYKKCETGTGDELEWFRASASMPLFANIVEVDGHKLLDGGIADSVPIKYLESIGYDRNVVVLTQPYGYIKGTTSLKRTIRMKYKKYPEFVKAVMKRPGMYNETIDYIRDKEKKGELFVISPPRPLDIGKIEHNPDKMYRVYQMGRAVMTAKLPKLTDYLSKEK